MKQPHPENPAQPGKPEGEAAAGQLASAAPASSAGGPMPAAANGVREIDGEPVVNRAPVPVLLIALLGALVYWGSMYIVEYGGEADARVHYPYTSFKELQDLQPKGEEEIMRRKGLQVYVRPTCSACHQNDGNGSASLNAPPLCGSEWVLEKDPSRLIRIALHGLSGPITVRRKERGLGQMVPWQDILTDEEIALVLTYARNSWGNKAPAVKPEQVKKVRDETKDWGTYMTVDELKKVALKE